MKLRTFFMSALTVIAFTWAGLAVPKADNLADTMAIVHKSLVLVKADGLGSGFVAHSSPESSAILTAAHLIGGRRSATIYLNDDPSVGYDASILRIDRTSDLALLIIKQGRMVPLILSTSVQGGEQIAVTGYPYASLDSLATSKKLRPSLHEGVVRSVRRGGSIVEYAAPTDRGYAGGPVLDLASGYYVGVVSFPLKNGNGYYDAVGPSAIHDFLKKSGFDIATMEYTPKRH